MSLSPLALSLREDAATLTKPEDLFRFWSRIPDNAFVHPDDEDCFRRSQHRFEGECLPISFFGPLKTAKVVLLFLSPGYKPSDKLHAQTAQGRAYYRRQRTGLARLPGPADHDYAHRWWTGIVRQFDPEPDRLADAIAVLNIGAYHSASFHDWHMLTALRSSRVALDHAQTVLFPAAERGERVVICLRSARLWGLSLGPDGLGRRFGQSLYAPRCTQGGAMLHGPMRQEVVAAVRTALRLDTRGGSGNFPFPVSGD